MANTFSIKVEGLEKLNSSLNKKAASLKKEINAEIGFAAEEAVGFMQSEAPADQGFLRGRISANQLGEMDWQIVSQSDYSGFLEFGTRLRVQIPAGLEDVAASIRANKGISPLDAKEAIFAWCRRKGIPPNMWYPVYLSLMTKGVTPHPFFFHNFERVKPVLLKNIENILRLEGFQ